ncbi:MAG TPA: glycine--tRNA ligase subunit beta, partial [Acidobacteriaceae bacterium]|nr:glycine--tRNA ligase subunit beta [Acidobacteriaceae bacterium]
TGMFRNGLIPSGSKDPFALRRAGAGVVRILTENEFLRGKLHLVSVVNASFTDGDWDDNFLRAKILDFMLDRLEFFLQESFAIKLQVARAARNSVIAAKYDGRVDELVGYGHVTGFARALNEEAASSNVTAVAELLKRTSNILRQAREKKMSFGNSVADALLREPAEKELSRRVSEVDRAIQKNYRAGNYSEVIAAIASLQQPLNAFFDSVMVMVDDPQLRGNRLGLLSRTESVVRWAADFSELASI